jgi:hypothetical protein
VRDLVGEGIQGDRAFESLPVGHAFDLVVIDEAAQVQGEGRGGVRDLVGEGIQGGASGV